MEYYIIKIEIIRYYSTLQHCNQKYKCLVVHIRGAYDKFPDFFRMGIYNCRRLLKIHYVIAIHLMTNFYDQLQQELEYTLLKPDCHSWGISKMQSGREDTLEERYAIKLCFKLRKNTTETYGMLQTAFGVSCMN